MNRERTREVPSFAYEPSLPFEYSARTHVGQQREQNEDSLVAQVIKGRFVGAVADGMGGHQAGETASRLAVEAIRKMAADLDETEVVRPVLTAAVQSANKQIHEAGIQNEQLFGMGTTLTGAVVEPGRAWLVHIGDSRAYLLRGGQIAQLTADDSLVEELVRRGHLSETEAQEHPRRNLLLRALGVAQTVDVELQEEPLQAGDILLLCSDGLTNMMSDREIASVVNATVTLEEAAEKLIELANARGGHDNISVVLVRCPDGRAPRPSVAPAVAFQESTGERSRRFWRSLLGVVGGGILVLGLLRGSLLLGRTLLERQYFLGVAGGQVVLYQGLPRQLMGRPLHRVHRLMNVPAERVKELYRDRLQKGIPVASPEEAQERLQEILQPDAENGTTATSL